GDPVDGRCDLFSLGTVLYRVCTGQAPFAGRDTVATLMEVANTQPLPPCAVAPEVPSALSELIMALLAKDPVDRPAAAEEVIKRITAIEASLLATATPSGPRAVIATATIDQTPALLARRRRGAFALVAGGVLLAAATVMYIKTDRGTLEIQSFDDAVKVSVEQGGEVVGILDPVSKQQLTIRSGKYRLQILGSDSAGLELVADHKATDTVTLNRGRKVIIEVKQHKPVAPAAPAAATLAPLPEEWVKTVRGLPPDRQVEEVRT